MVYYIHPTDAPDPTYVYGDYRMSGGKEKRTNSGATARKMTVAEDINHAATQLQIDDPTHAEAIWTTIRRKRTRRQVEGCVNKPPDNNKLASSVNKYACLIQKDQLEINRNHIFAYTALLRTLHPQPVRKMISGTYARLPTTKLDRGKVKVNSARQKRKMTLNHNSEYPTSELDNGTIRSNRPD